MAKCEIKMKVDIRDVEKHIKQLEGQVEDWKSDHEHNLKLMKGLNNRIAELEKDKCELLGIIQDKDKAIQGLQKDKAYAEEQLDLQIKATLELQKENAELKNIERMAIYTKLSDQLAQTKELIKSLIEEVTSYEEINDYDKCEAVVEAEQFLKKVK